MTLLAPTHPGVVAALAALLLGACGVKSDLLRPAGPVLRDEARDASKPPVPLGEPGGNTPPYSTGP
jgi:hypothetical protein